MHVGAAVSHERRGDHSAEEPYLGLVDVAQDVVELCSFQSRTGWSPSSCVRKDHAIDDRLSRETSCRDRVYDPWGYGSMKESLLGKSGVEMGASARLCLEQVRAKGPSAICGKEFPSMPSRRCAGACMHGRLALPELPACTRRLDAGRHLLRVLVTTACVDLAMITFTTKACCS